MRETTSLTGPSAAAGAASSSPPFVPSSSTHHNHPLSRKVERILSRPLDLTYLPDALSSLSSVFVSSSLGSHPSARVSSSVRHANHDISQTAYPVDANCRSTRISDEVPHALHGNSHSFVSSSPLALASSPAALSALLYRERLRIHAECLSAFSPIRSKVHALSARVQALRNTFSEVSVHLRHSQHQLKPLLRQVSQLRSTYQHLRERQKLCQLLLDKLQLSPHHLRALTATSHSTGSERVEGEELVASSHSVAASLVTSNHPGQRGHLSSDPLLPSPPPRPLSSSSSSSSPLQCQESPSSPSSASSSSSSASWCPSAPSIHIDTNFFIALQELEKVRRRALRLQAMPPESIELFLSSREDRHHCLSLSGSSPPAIGGDPQRYGGDTRKEVPHTSFGASRVQSAYATELHLINTRELADYILQETADLRELAYERLYLWVQDLFKQAVGLGSCGAEGGGGGLDKFMSPARFENGRKEGAAAKKPMREIPPSTPGEGKRGIPLSSEDERDNGAALQKDERVEKKERAREELRRRHEVLNEIEDFSRFLSALGGMRGAEVQYAMSRVLFVSRDGSTDDKSRTEDEGILHGKVPRGEFERERVRGRLGRSGGAVGEEEERRKECNGGHGLEVTSGRPIARDGGSSLVGSSTSESRTERKNQIPLLLRAFLALRDRPPYLLDCIHEYLRLRSLCLYESIFGMREAPVSPSGGRGSFSAKKTGPPHHLALVSPQQAHPEVTGGGLSLLLDSYNRSFSRPLFQAARRLAVKWLEAEAKGEGERNENGEQRTTFLLPDTGRQPPQARSTPSSAIGKGEKEDDEDLLCDLQSGHLPQQTSRHTRRSRRDMTGRQMDRRGGEEEEEEPLTSVLPIEVFLRAEPVRFIKHLLERFCRSAALERSIVQGILTVCSYASSPPPRKDEADEEANERSRRVGNSDGSSGATKEEQDSSSSSLTSASLFQPNHHHHHPVPGESFLHEEESSLDTSVHRRLPPLEQPALSRGSAGAGTGGIHSRRHPDMVGEERGGDSSLSGGGVFEMESGLGNTVMCLDGDELLGDIIYPSSQQIKIALDKAFSMMILNAGGGQAGIGGGGGVARASLPLHRSQRLHHVLGTLLIVRLLDSYAQAMYAVLLFSHPLHDPSSQPCTNSDDAESVTATSLSTTATCPTDRAGVPSVPAPSKGLGSDEGAAAHGALVVAVAAQALADTKDSEDEREGRKGNRPGGGVEGLAL